MYLTLLLPYIPLSLRLPPRLTVAAVYLTHVAISLKLTPRRLSWCLSYHSLSHHSLPWCLFHSCLSNTRDSGDGNNNGDAEGTTTKASEVILSGLVFILVLRCGGQNRRGDATKPDPVSRSSSSSILSFLLFSFVLL